MTRRETAGILAALAAASLAACASTSTHLSPSGTEGAPLPTPSATAPVATQIFATVALVMQQLSEFYRDLLDKF